jgi:hypothetical protein
LLRTAFLFLGFALPAAALDVYTTELGRRSGDAVELNPRGFLPLPLSVGAEVLLMVIATVMVAVGAYFRRNALYNAACTPYDKFGDDLFGRRVWAVALLGVPFFGAILRYPDVISNACYLIMGWSPIDSVSLLPLQALLGDDAMGYIAFNTLAVLVLWYPVAALIIRSLYAVHRRPQRPPNQSLPLTRPA